MNETDKGDEACGSSQGTGVLHQHAAQLAPLNMTYRQGKTAKGLIFHIEAFSTTPFARIPPLADVRLRVSRQTSPPLPPDFYLFLLLGSFRFLL